MTNLRFFDGVTLSMQEGRNILFVGNRISALPTLNDVPEDAEIIDCGGRSVIPGLIDTHWRSTLLAVSQLAAMTQDVGFIHLMAGREAGATLQRGFTTVRDVGGPAFGLKMAIDRGAASGARIFPSGAMISQTSGLESDCVRNHHASPIRRPAISSGRAWRCARMVLRAARGQLMKGTSQIKIMAGGGVSSLYDPLDTTQHTVREMCAAA